jgi:hypothetical protein
VVELLGPVVAAAGEVLTVADQALVEMAREQRDAISTGVVSEEMAGEADRAAAAGLQDLLIQSWPLLQGFAARGLDAGEGERDHDSTACVRLY